jgi:uncharacterized membrane protein YeaQ/YmgE (transglycosylase-associated protein family)
LARRAEPDCGALSLAPEGAGRARGGKVGGGYFVALALGALPGAWAAGSLNSLRGPQPSLSHSVVGALVGAIVAVEIYKALRGVKRSTGGIFAGPFALGVVVGRLGCFFAGVADGTYGSPTQLPWGVDLGTTFRVIQCSYTRACRWRCLSWLISPAWPSRRLGDAARLLRPVHGLWRAKVPLGVPQALSQVDRAV